MDDDSDEGNKENKSIARTRKQGGKQKQGAVTSKKAHQAAQAAELSKRAEERATKVIPVQSPCDKKADISCCMVCAAREWRRAVQARDTHLIRRLEKWYRQDIAVPRWAARPDVAHDTALYDAILTNSRQVYDPIIEMSENDRVQPPTRFYQSDSAETGFASRNAYSHRVKTVNESRGNREGNNAFYRTVTRDPFAFLVVPFNRKNPDTKALQREDAILLRLLADHAVTTATIDDLMDEYPVFRDALARWGLYEAAAAGNAALTLHLVGLLENGYGFNHLHSEVLKTGDGASLPSFRKNQVLKKAFGNFAITPLEVAAIAPTAAFLKELYSAITSAEASEPDERGRTALHFAAGSSQPGCLKFLLEQGMDATKGDNMKVTPLLLAARYGREANVRLLVESVGSADHTVLKEGYTALHFASHFSQSAVVNLLLSLGAKPNGLDKKLKATPLIYASQQGNLEVVQALAEGGADLCLGDKMGRTPLMFASKNGHWDLVKFLLHAGVDTSALDTSENTALHYAAGYGWPDVVRLLIDVGDADVNVANNWKYTPLMVADMKGHMEVVRLLLSLPSVGVNHCDNEGFSMLHRTLTTAVTTANEAERLLEKTQLLLDRGADPNTQNLAGDTVLHLLAADKHPNLKKKPDEQPTTSATTVELGQGNEDSDGVVDMDMDPVEDGTDCEGIAQASDAVNGNSRHPTPSKSGESTDATSVLPATENEVVAMETDEVTADVGTTGESTTLLTEGVEKSQVVNEEPRVWRTFYIEDFENLRRKQLELFLQHGANLNAMNKADETPLSIALQSSNTVAISLFLEKGSDITITKVTKDGASGNILHYLLDIAQEADTRHMYFERYGSANYGRATGAQLWKNETEVVQTISTYLKNLSLEALQNLVSEYYSDIRAHTAHYSIRW
ncbi:ankyrin repeat-containing domain protein [Gaertneriomyces semiglobifer]|nr:ankyrin repeat-containing domain protein [Gaertneriomyces semiglobifer]